MIQRCKKICSLDMYYNLLTETYESAQRVYSELVNNGDAQKVTAIVRNDNHRNGTKDAFHHCK